MRFLFNIVYTLDLYLATIIQELAVSPNPSLNNFKLHHGRPFVDPDILKLPSSLSQPWACTEQLLNR